MVAALNETRAKEFAGVPGDLQDQESELKRNLRYYEQQLTTGRENGDEVSLSELQNKVFTLKNEYDLLIENIEKNYPQYYRLKYESNTVSVADLKNSLQDKELLVEYYLGQSSLYTFVFGRDFSDFVKVNLEEDFLDAVNHMRSLLSKMSGDMVGFRSVSHRLYSTLILPFQHRLKGQHITFIPDNELGYIPFEILQHSAAKSDYLIEDHAISYTYSATFRNQIIGNKRSNNEIRYLAFAPNFNDRNQAGDPEVPDLLAYDDVVRGNLVELEGAHREVESLASFFEGDYFRNFDAHESLFKKVGKNYEIIHLATHAIIDDLNPLNSRLLFTIQGDSLDDGNLHAWELFSLNLNAGLAVLSACNTGFGKIQKGEGIQSLGRAFAYAGCPSRLMSLWPAQDASTARIMESFYNHLSKGIAKDEALRQAKLKFLQDATDLNEHPFYWAGFVLQGDPSPLVGKKHRYLWGLVLAMLMVFLLIYRRNFLSRINVPKEGT